MKTSNTMSTQKSKPKIIHNIRKSYLKARNTIRKLDQSLNWINFFDSVNTIMSIMFEIYACFGVNNKHIFKSFLNYHILHTLLNVMKLIINCLIHGMVYEESTRLSQCLDEINLSNKSLDENSFKEALYFKTNTFESIFGFTVYGIPFNKNTLLSVCLI